MCTADKHAVAVAKSAAMHALQVLLETLFSRMQVQAGLFADLSRRVGNT